MTGHSEAEQKAAECFAACNDHKCVYAGKCMGLLSVPRERGRQFGALYAGEGRNYGKPYPSNPYNSTDPRSAQYEAGYEEGFNDRRPAS